MISWTFSEDQEKHYWIHQNYLVALILNSPHLQMLLRRATWLQHSLIIVILACFQMESWRTHLTIKHYNYDNCTPLFLPIWKASFFVHESHVRTCESSSLVLLPSFDKPISDPFRDLERKDVTSPPSTPWHLVRGIEKELYGWILSQGCQLLVPISFKSNVKFNPINAIDMKLCNI